jgi:hypothetical protein
LHTTRVWSSVEATTNWETFDAYMRSQRVSSSVSLYVGLAVAGICLWQYTRSLRSGERTQ